MNLFFCFSRDVVNKYKLFLTNPKDFSLIFNRILFVYVSTGVSWSAKVRKPYQSDVRKKTLQFSETSKKLRALTAASIESALTASCRCSIRCCSKATENMVRTARKSFYALNTSEQKQFLIDELLKNGVRTESSWRFQFFISGKQVRFILFFNLD